MIANQQVEGQRFPLILTMRGAGEPARMGPYSHCQVCHLLAYDALQFITRREFFKLILGFLRQPPDSLKENSPEHNRIIAVMSKTKPGQAMLNSFYQLYSYF